MNSDAQWETVMAAYRWMDDFGHVQTRTRIGSRPQHLYECEGTFTFYT